jgi:hypothetical protein
MMRILPIVICAGLALGPAQAQFAAGQLTQTETLEVPGPSQHLFSNPWYQCTRNFYVNSSTGNDANSGVSPVAAWQHIQHPDNPSRTGGDCIHVAPGTYSENIRIEHGGNAPTATGYVVYRCEVMNACHVLSRTTASVWGFRNFGSFVVVDGFEVDGNNALVTDGASDVCFLSSDPAYGAGGSSLKAGASAHHLWILNNIIHHCNLAGVGFQNKEWYYVVHNTVYHNAFQSGYQGSGIGLVVVQCIEQGGTNCYTSGIVGTPTSFYSYVPSGNDNAFNPPAAWSPFHNVVAWNVAYNNRINYKNPIGCGSLVHTDGNGIIIDTFLDGFSNTLTFPYQTLVMNNVSYYNGGRGLHVFRASNVTVANNSVYNNLTDTCILRTGTKGFVGDFSQVGGSNNVWINNLSKPVPNLGSACALLAGNGPGVPNINETYTDNVLNSDMRNTTLSCIFDNDASVPYFSCSNNKCSTDPSFVDATPGVNATTVGGAPTGGTWIPGHANFALSPSSPAIGYVSPRSFLPAQNVDAGACHHSLTVCPNPGTTNY